MLVFEDQSEELKGIFLDVQPGNTGLTAEMLEYEPKEKVLNYGNIPNRLVFYSETEPLTEEELAKIKELKDFCSDKGEKLPDQDREILKLLYSKKMNVLRALDALKARVEFRKGFPVEVNSRVFEFLNSGLVYIAGRDRSYRPIIAWDVN